MRRLVQASLFLMLLTGCAAKYVWVADSFPRGATVTLSTGQSCRTPCSIRVNPSDPFIATFNDKCALPIEILVVPKAQAKNIPHLAEANLGRYKYDDRSSGFDDDLVPNPLSIEMRYIEDCV